MDFFETVADKIAAGTQWGQQLGSKVAQQAATTGRAVRDGTVAAARTARDNAVAAARATAEKARAGYDWTKQKAGEGIDWTKKKGQQAVQATEDGIDQAKKKVGEGVDWTKKKAGEGVDWAKQKGKQLDNSIVGGIASGVGRAATANKTVERCIENMARNKNRVADPRDGQFMGNDCPKTSPNPPTTGRLPQGCAGSGGKLPKIIYTNGINTTPEAACATMHKIADERCAEVIGVYNATYGTVEDGLDSKDNIDRAGREPAAHSQARLLTEMLNEKPPQRVTVYAHSQGGLITQEGLAETQIKLQRSAYAALRKQGMSPVRARQESERYTRQKMGSTDVYSFGTAESNWPSTGTRYHQYTNTADPVPKLITSVQNNRGILIEPTNLAERHRFTKNAWNPIEPHSMDNTYLPELNRIHPVPKKTNGRCC